MGSIKSFPSPDGGGSHVIERLEEALEMAKSGQIANVMVVMVALATMEPIHPVLRVRVEMVDREQHRLLQGHQ